MDEQIKKKVLRSITYGLYVAIAEHENRIAAGTINWLSQCSFKPPLVMMGLKKDSHLYSYAKESKHITVNILGKDQKDVAQAFFGPTNIEEMKLNSYEFYRTETGGIALKICPYLFEARIEHIYEKGDHSVVVAEVINAILHREEEPLAMFSTGWFYGG